MKVHNAKDRVVEKRLRRRARACEEEAVNKLLPRTRVDLSNLNDLLNNVYNCHRPKPADYDTRSDLIRVFNEIAKEIYGFSIESPVIEPYGSFVMDMFSNQSDLDLSINFKQTSFKLPREQKIKILKKFANKFHFLQQKGHVAGVESILTAKVPIVKVIDLGSKVECDFSVENRDGIRKSQIIHIISGIDDRFQKLCVLMKLWAKAWEINSSRDRTLNSISIISLVAFHLQTRNPAILPPLSHLYKDGVDPANIRRRIERKFMNWGKKNDESLGWLFVTLLIKLKSVEKLWSEGLCANLYRGFWTSKSWNTGVASISIEDFTDLTQNFARAVGEIGLSQIYGSIESSISYLKDFFDGKKSGSDLRECLFGGCVSKMPPSSSLSVLSNPDERSTTTHHPPRRTGPEEDNTSKGKRTRHDEICSPAQPTGHVIPSVFTCNPAQSTGHIIPPVSTRNPDQPTGHSIPSVFTRNPAIPISGNPPKPPSTLPAFRSNADENSDLHLRKRSRVADEYDGSRRMPTSWYGEINSPGPPTAPFISSVFSHGPARPFSQNFAMPPSTLPAFRSNTDENSDRHLRKRSHGADEYYGSRSMPTSWYSEISTPRQSPHSSVFSHNTVHPFPPDAAMLPSSLQTFHSNPNENVDQHPRKNSPFADDDYGRSRGKRTRYDEISCSNQSNRHLVSWVPISSTVPVASRYQMPPHQAAYEPYHNRYRFPRAPFQG